MMVTGIVDLRHRLRDFDDQVLSDRILKTLRIYHNRVLVRDGGIEYTGKQLLLLSKKLARTVRANSRDRDAVGILFPNGLALIVSLLGVIIANRVPVLLSPGSHLKKLDQIPLSLLLSFESQILTGSAKRILRLSPEAQVVSKQVVPNRLTQLIPAHLDTGMILYTSGSSGEAKGVEIPAAGILYLADSLKNIFALNHSTISPIILPMTHTMCINTHFFPTFFAGGLCNVISTSFSMGSLFRHILSSEGTLVAATTELLTFLLEEKIRRNLAPANQVLQVQISGGMISERDIERARELFPNAKLHKCYGLTEATRLAMISSDDADFDSVKKCYSPLPQVNFEVRAADGRILAAGEAGEIYVKAPTVACAYRGSAETLCDERGYLKTGDWGEIDRQGKITLLGRRDGIIKINGKRLSAFEIEANALRIVPRTRSAKFLSTRVQERDRGLLFLEVGDGNLTLSDEQLKAVQSYVREHIGIGIKVIYMREFPRGDNGKVLTRTLIDLEQGLHSNPAGSLASR